MVSRTPLQQAKAVLGQPGAECGLRAGAFLKFGQYIVPDTTLLVRVEFLSRSLRNTRIVTSTL